MKCPKCSDEIVYENSYEEEYRGDVCINYCHGYCTACNTNYKWKEIYEYSHYKDLEEY